MTNVVSRINEIAALTSDMDVSETCGIGGHILCEVSTYVKDMRLRRDMINTGESIIEAVHKAPGNKLEAQAAHDALNAISDKLYLAKPHLVATGSPNATRLVNGAILRCEWLLGRHHDLVWSPANQNNGASNDPNAPTRRVDADADRRAKKVERKKRRPTKVKMKLKPGPGGGGRSPGM